MTTFPSAPPPCPASAARPRRAPKFNHLPRTQKLNSLTFLKSPKSSAHASGAWRHSHPPGHISIWDFYFDISEWDILPARAWTPARMLHLTNPCAKRKVLSLTKPKGKIYKTKSLGHYVTHIWVEMELIQSFSKRISITWNANNIIQDLDSAYQFFVLKKITITWCMCARTRAHMHTPTHTHTHTYIYIYIYIWVLWHINHCWLFNATSCFYL